MQSLATSARPFPPTVLPCPQPSVGRNRTEPSTSESQAGLSSSTVCVFSGWGARGSRELGEVLEKEPCCFQAVTGGQVTGEKEGVLLGFFPPVCVGQHNNQFAFFLDSTPSSLSVVT